MSTAEQPDAPARPIEEPAAAASVGDAPPADLAPVVEALRAEIAALRGELTARVDAAVARVQHAPAGSESDRAGATSPAEPAQGAGGPPEARLAVLESSHAVLAERLEALARDGAATTRVLQSLTETVRSVDRRLAGQGDELGRALLEGLGGRLDRSAAAAADSRRALGQLREALSGTTAELAAELRASAQEQAEASAARLLGLDDRVRAELGSVREAFDERTEQLAGVLARGLTDIADEVDVAATTTRDASERVTVLAEVTELQRADVERLLQGVRDEVQDSGRALREDLLARTTQQLAALGQRLDQLQEAVTAGATGVGERLGAVDARLAQAAGSGERALAGVEEATAATERLSSTVESFRTEWPTRTWEVVQGARAVAEAVVLDVRAEVGRHLQDVRAVLDGLVGTVEDARSGLDDGTDRLAAAGHVLVGYLEQRDRLLEAERDRVLHDVLDAFAAGLSARERNALAGRVSDAVARRRDARDAERYREALGAPVPPTVPLPDDVLGLAAGHSAAAVEGPDDATALEEPDGATPDGSEHEGAPPPAGAGSAGPTEGSGAAVEPAAVEPAADEPRPSAPRPSVARSGRGGAAVVPGPGRAPGAVPARDRSGAAARRRSAAPSPGAASKQVPGRGRLDAMPQAPSVDVALDAAAPEDPAAAQDGRPARS